MDGDAGRRLVGLVRKRPGTPVAAADVKATGSFAGTPRLPVTRRSISNQTSTPTRKRSSQ